MVAFLEFMTLDTDGLRAFLRDGDEALERGLLAQFADADPALDEESRERRLVASEIIRSLCGGPLGRDLAQRPLFPPPGREGLPVTAVKAAILAAVFSRFGEVFASVQHSHRAGAVFREEAFDHLRELGILGDLDPRILLVRPLFDHYSPLLPSWGGMTADELQRLDRERLFAARADSGDSDVDSWVNALLNGIEEALLRGRDVLTLYE